MGLHLQKTGAKLTVRLADTVEFGTTVAVIAREQRRWRGNR